MKTTILRAVVTLASVVAIATAGAAGVRAADPNTLGLSVYPPKIDPAQSRDVQVTNAGTLETVYTFTTPDGYSVSPATITLEPGERVTVTLNGDGEGGRLIVSGSLVSAAGANADTTSAGIGVVIVPSSSWPTVWRVLLAVGLVFAVIRFLVALRRLSRKYRLTRVEP